MKARCSAWMILGTGLALLVTISQVRAGQQPAPAQQGEGESFALFESIPAAREGAPPSLRVIPGTPEEAETYYREIYSALVGFPRPSLRDSAIGDMLVYFGFPALVNLDLERIESAVLMDFERLRRAVSNPQQFEAAYRDRPLRTGEIVVTRFFAPKIINVRDPFVGGVPKGGFGWRKVLRFRARDGSAARAAGLDSFYLLFNFTSQAPKFPEGVSAGQIQALVTPAYPTGGRHRDLYFLVYEGLGTPNAGKVGTFLVATFDLAGVVPDDKYYVPRSCGQCHGTERTDQRGGKINYLDTDHWIDRTGYEFTRVDPADVLVDGAPGAYAPIRTLNREIETQNAAVIAGGDPRFALLATRKWLDLHGEGSPDETRHVPPLRRGFADQAGDPVWTAGQPTDEALLPMLNQHCFRCHSSVRYHVFEKKAVTSRAGSMAARINACRDNPRGCNMPQGEILDQPTKDRMSQLLRQLTAAEAEAPEAQPGTQQ